MNNLLYIKGCGQQTITVHRYGASNIYSDDDLVFSMQESIRKAMAEKGITYFGENVLKDAVVAWSPYDKLQQEIEKDFKFFEYAFIALSVILMIFFIINTISVGILNRTKEIGILKALGAKNKDLFNIYLTEAFIL